MEFYVLRKPKPGTSDADTEFLQEDEVQGPAPRCALCGHLVGALSWLPPYRVELETWGRSFGDVVFGPGDDFLVSQRFKQMFLISEFSGLEGFEPVEIVKVTKHRKLTEFPPHYYHVRVVRGEAAIDQEASGFEWNEPPTCPQCRQGRIIRRWKRIILEPNTWSGEDIFIPRGLFAYMTTERFKNICEENATTNIVFVPAGEYAHDFYPWEKKEGS